MDLMTLMMYDENELSAIYERVVEEPNRNSARKGFIRCPNCGEEILMIPTLRVMQQAIENHVRKHKDLLEENPIKAHQAAIFIRLSLTRQVLQFACKQQIQ